ncbi:hypothetical protein CVV65_06295 [Kyrpidia spormannii]|uniref:Cytosolic protein n=1 Tax=Kyrpidia spormannii TaxID=2055160 RepID=A0A2K8N5J1_9BACL|nr:DUF6282 family protein [Kyrpidia spormannii]ATY84604.1 hypothetical protein CVV65_06295 [Kyrpidia spormannii]
MNIDRSFLQGFIDIHVHSAPSIFPRSVTDQELAEQVRDAGMRGFVLKAHEECTVSRAEILKRSFPELDIFGSLVLNVFVGGLNPYAVDLALKRGAKIIWMPTGSAKHHLGFYGGSDYSAQKSEVALRPLQGIEILDKQGRVIPVLYEILDMIAEAGAVAASGHLSPRETIAFVEAAQERGVEKILVAHPDLGVTQMPLDLQVDLARKGAYLEKSYLPLMPDWKTIDIEQMVDSIRRIGPERCVLQTDFGQVNHPSPPEGYRSFVSLLLKSGLPDRDIRRMGAQNPAELLNLPDKS